MLKNIYNKLNSLDYMQYIFTDFIELAGDRISGEDRAIIGGIANINNIPVTVLAQIMGRNMEENIKANFSMMKPTGYRKVIRHLKQAEKFKRPVICFVDTIGADPGEEAEREGQASAIADTIMEMLILSVPIFSIIIGNGGSGGALALCVSNKIAMLESAHFGVISPRGGANILWKDSSRYEEAAQKLRMSANDLLQYHIIDKIIKERELEITANSIKQYIVSNICHYGSLSKEEIIDARRKKFIKLGGEYLYNIN